MRKILFGIIGACMMVAGLSVIPTNTAPAFAACDPADLAADCDGDGVKNRFEASGWWQDSQEQNAYNRYEWLYPDFPTTCDQGTSDYRWQILWVYPDTSTPIDLKSTVRDAVHAVNSGYAASAREVISSKADLTTAHIPRWDVNTNCEATITNVPIPIATWNSLAPNGWGTLWNYLKSAGYNDPHVKYLSLMQSDPGMAAGGAAGGTFNANDPGQDNPINQTSHATEVATGRIDSNDWSLMAYEMFHEMTHAMGAVEAEQPHYNTQNPMHPTDCGDLLCYYNSTLGEVFDGTCGTGGVSSRDNGMYHVRLDCHDDDYWNAAGASWTTTRWNMYNSLQLNANIPTGTINPVAGKTFVHADDELK